MLQTPCKCLTNVANASEFLANITNGLRMLAEIDGDWRRSQQSLKLWRRLLNWSIFVSRCRMTCERSEFVTNACKYSAIVANFERMSIIFIRQHIRKHIRLCVRAALPTLPMACECLRKLTTIDSIRNIRWNLEDALPKFVDIRKQVENDLWTFRICYQRSQTLGECSEFWKNVKYFYSSAHSQAYSPMCESSIDQVIEPATPEKNVIIGSEYVWYFLIYHNMFVAIKYFKLRRSIQWDV